MTMLYQPPKSLSRTRSIHALCCIGPATLTLERSQKRRRVSNEKEQVLSSVLPCSGVDSLDGLFSSLVQANAEDQFPIVAWVFDDDNDEWRFKACENQLECWWKMFGQSLLRISYIPKSKTHQSPCWYGQHLGAVHIIICSNWCARQRTLLLLPFWSFPVFLFCTYNLDIVIRLHNTAYYNWLRYHFSLGWLRLVAYRCSVSPVFCVRC